jgi:hypothetical protein
MRIASSPLGAHKVLCVKVMGSTGESTLQQALSEKLLPPHYCANFNQAVCTMLALIHIVPCNTVPVVGWVTSPEQHGLVRLSSVV